MGERKVLVGVLGAVVLLGLLVVLLVVNPSWSPVSTVRDRVDGTQAQEVVEVEKAEERLQESLMLVPSDAYMVSHANMSSKDGVQQWWANYYNFLPPGSGLPATIPGELEVTSLTYTAFPNWELHADGIPFSWAIVLSADESQRDPIVEYLNNANEGNLFVHTAYRESNAYIVVSPVDTFSVIDDLVRAAGAPAGTDAFEDITSLDEFRVDNEHPALYYNFGSWLDTLTKYVPAEASLYQDYLELMRRNWFGFVGEPEFVGTSQDQGATWQGEFVTGGVDISAIDLQAFADATTEQEYWWNGTDGEDGFDYGYWSEGLGVVQEAASVTMDGATLGAVYNPHKLAAGTLEAPPVKGKASILISPQMMQTSLQSTVAPYGIKTVWLVVDKKGATDLTFSFYQDSDFG